MAQTYVGSFSRRGPDILTEEMAEVLSGTHPFEFKALFTTVMVKLRARKAVGGGEEMLRLRMYEKLQSLVGRGMVEKTSTALGKEYRGLPSLSSMLAAVATVPPLVG